MRFLDTALALSKSTKSTQNLRLAGAFPVENLNYFKKIKTVKYFSNLSEVDFNPCPPYLIPAHSKDMPDKYLSIHCTMYNNLNHYKNFKLSQNEDLNQSRSQVGWKDLRPRKFSLNY